MNWYALYVLSMKVYFHIKLMYYNWKLITTFSVASHNLEYHLVCKHTPILLNAIKSSNFLARKRLIYSCRTNGTRSAKVTMVEKPFSWKIRSAKVKMKKNTFSSNFFGPNWKPFSYEVRSAWGRSVQGLTVPAKKIALK